ncbi:hypothetical protein Tco_0935772 [Tanacetum coccineum]
MESKDMVSSYLDKDEQELQRLKKEMKKKFDNIFHHFQICIHGLRPDWFHQSGEYAFQTTYKEELHAYNSKTCLAVLKKQFEPFFDLKSSLSSSYQYQSELALQKKIFQEACHEEELRITEKDVKDKQEKLAMEKQETIIQKSKCSSPGDSSDTKREKQEMKENYSKTF